MTRFRKQLISGMTAFGILAGGVSAFAQTTPAAPATTQNSPEDQNGKRMSHEQKMEKMKQRMAARMAELHQKLQLTPGQEAAWSAYVERMQPGAHPARPSREEMANLTTPERMERRLAMMQEMQKQMAARVEATKEFYAILTPAQKKVFDEESARGWNGHGRHHHGHHGR